MRYKGPAYRAIGPRYSYKPLSGKGAAINGGRFNPKGIEALYLSLKTETALREYEQGLGRLPPVTLCEYEVDCEDIIDLRVSSIRKTFGIETSELSCAWKTVSPAPSQEISSRLIEAGIAGILVPSFAYGAKQTDHNLVLWKWGPRQPYYVAVYDPTNKLPKDDLSWA